MRKNKLIGGIIIIFLVIITLLFITFRKSENKEDISYTLENKELKLYVADSPAEWAQGLMHYRKLEEVDGMIFRFPEKQERSFWNKNTFLDLDIYWINDGQVVGKDFLPSIEKSKQLQYIYSPEPVDTVIEVAK